MSICVKSEYLNLQSVNNRQNNEFSTKNNLKNAKNVINREICPQWATRQGVNLSTTLHVFSSKLDIENDAQNGKFGNQLLKKIVFIFNIS